MMLFRNGMLSFVKYSQIFFIRYLKDDIFKYRELTKMK